MPVSRFSNHWFNTCTSVNSMVAQLSIQYLPNGWFNASTTVESTFAYLSNQWLCNRRFDARFQTLTDMLFQLRIYFMLSYFTSCLDVSYYNFKRPGKFFQMIGKYRETILLKSLNFKVTKRFLTNEKLYFKRQSDMYILTSFPH